MKWGGRDGKSTNQSINRSINQSIKTEAPISSGVREDSTSEVDPDPVGSGFIWVRGSGSRGIKSLGK